MNCENKTKKQLLLHSRDYNSSFLSVENDKTNSDASDLELPSKMNTKVSFSHLVEFENDPDHAPFDSTTTSLTATPKRSSSASAMNKSQALSKRQRIFFVCFHLPVNLSHDDHLNEWNAAWAESLLAATEGSQVVSNYETHWIGTVSCASHPITTQEDRDAVTICLANMNCTPLFLDKDTLDAHYLGMCKQVLWPAFHNVDLLDLSSSASGAIPQSPGKGTDHMGSDWDQSRLDFWWKAYKEVNAAFADTLATFLKPGDVMWVHDYHLSLLPKIMDDRERVDVGRSITKKVFLLHIPFPTSQVFRELECGEDILKGMLHADVVGFHAFDHARHFLNGEWL